MINLLIVLIFAAVQNEVWCIYNGKQLLIPPYMRVCHRSDPFLSECVQRSVEELRPYLRDGLPELGLPPLEPLRLMKMSLDHSEGGLTLRSEYNNIVVKGASYFKLTNVKVDAEKLCVELSMWFPKLDMDAQYAIKGRILILPIDGSGLCQGNYTDVTANAHMQAEKVIRGGEEYLKVQEIKLNFNIGGAKIKLNNLFGGDTELGNAMNSYLNENWRAITGELRPALQNALIGLVRGVADKIFAAFPYNMLLPK